MIANLPIISGRGASIGLVEAFRRKRAQVGGSFPLPVLGVEIVNAQGAPTAWFQALSRKAGLTLAQDAAIVDGEGKPTPYLIERWNAWQ